MEFNVKIQDKILATKPMSNIEIQMFLLHKVQTLIHLH